MLATFFRTIILYFLLLVVMRLMGKREIGQLQPYELVVAIIIADLAAIPIADSGIPITNGIIPILGILFISIIISNLNMKSAKIRTILCGQPSILIYRGKLNEKVLKKEKFTITELQERLRTNNIFDLAEVEYAILETNGQITVIQKPEQRNLKPKDLNIVPDYEGINYDLIIDGKVCYENLKKLNKTFEWLKNEINKFKLEPEDVLIATINAKGEIFCQGKERKK